MNAPIITIVLFLEHRFECKITDLCSIVNYVKEKENASTLIWKCRKAVKYVIVYTNIEIWIPDFAHLLTILLTSMVCGMEIVR